MEEVKKEKKNGALIGIIVILLIAVIGLCGYIFLNKDNTTITKYISGNTNKSTNAKNQKNEESNSKTQETNPVIIFDGSKAINSDEKNYTLSCQGSAGIWITVDSTQKVLTFSYTPAKVVEIYPISWQSTRNDLASSTINFEKKIVDVFFGGMGQSSSGDTVFILLEDGTVEYIPIVHMFNNAQDGPISYGTINGVSDVAKFTLSSTAGGVTTLAIKNDGSFYDLWYALKDTGNY